MQYSIMNEMENHQQALLVVLSYVIGFITAFIMFGLADLGKGREEVHLNQLPEDMLPDEETVSLSPAVMPGLHSTEEGLVVAGTGIDGRLISALTDDDVAELGFHVAIADSDDSGMSHSFSYAHYCAQMNVAEEKCQHFVYSLNDDKTYTIKNEDGSPLVTTNDEADSVTWSSDSEISMGGKTASPETMWVLR